MEKTKTPRGPTVKQFMQRFPDDDSCLEHLFRVRWGARHECAKCKREARYYRVKARRSYECEHCGYQVYPTAGTPFEATRTSLKDWFFVMFLFCASRNGVAAKEVQRQIGVTYKTAWRMCTLIRQYMVDVDGDATRGGPGATVEVDETFVGGLDLGKGKAGDDKVIEFGMTERDGEVITRVVDDRCSLTIAGQLKANVAPGTRIISDAWFGYSGVSAWSYSHAMLNKAKGERVKGDATPTTLKPTGPC